MKKRQFATMLLAVPLMTGGLVFAEDVVHKPADAAMQQADSNAVVTRRISKCIGKDLYNHDGKKIGDVKEVVLDGGTNRVSYVVVSYGGLMGIGDKLFAVPWNALESRSIEPDKTFLNVNEETMKNAPGFDEKHWPDMADKTFRDQVDRYYGNVNKTGGASDVKSDVKHNMNEMANNAKEGNPDVKDGLLWCRRASAVIGADVRNPANENLGSIEDLVVDAKTGKIHYAVLSFGGLLGIGDKLFAIPINALQAKADDEKFVLDATKERLKAAPGFNKKNWPDFADASFRKSVDDYYNPEGGMK